MTIQKPGTRSSAAEYFLAFSLVEVVLALGLVSFAVIAILGLLPTGLLSLRSAMSQTVEAQIVRTIGAQSVVAPFTNLANVAYFDDEGISVGPDLAYYTASVTKSTPLFPNSTAAGILTNSLTALKIEIVARPAPSAPGKTNFFTIFVANAGK